jgi:rhodanese-related sulfurtransferase
VNVQTRRRTLCDLVAEARDRIERFEPQEAYDAAADDALIVDIRSELARGRDGVITGALHVPRTVLEWRLDPDSPWRNPLACDLERRVIVMCDHGYSSSLAAATLVELGFSSVGDIVGGFLAWRDAGLPVAGAPAPSENDLLPGMGGPDL